MLAADVAEVVRIKCLAFDVDPEDPVRAARARRQADHILATAPGCSFVAELGGRVTGAAQALRRESLWCLSLLAVDPSAQSAGAGRALLAAALGCAAPGDAGMIVASNDHRALRLYGLAGFAPHPTMEADGEVDRSALPRPDPRVRDAGEEDLERLEQVSRELRGAAHTQELRFALAEGTRLLALGDSGYVAGGDDGVWLLAARDEDDAATLLWHALAAMPAGAPGRPPIRWITGGQRWAVEVALRAGLRLRSYGALCVRGEPGPLRPYLPSGPFA